MFAVLSQLLKCLCAFGTCFGAVGTRFAPRFAKHGSKSGKQREMKMAVQYEDNILPDLKPFLDENLRLTAIPAKNKKKLSALYYLAGKIEPNRDYTEPEINDILDDWTCDLIPLPNRTGNYFTRSFFESIRMNSSTAALFAL